MPELHRLSRRQLLADLGKGTLAVAILGTAVVACDGDNDASGDAGTTTAPSTTAPPTSGTDSTSTREATTEEVRDPFSYERVSLGFVAAYVLARGEEAVVVDTGAAGSAPQIESALDTLGHTWGDVGHVMLTHLHSDHVGSIGDVLASAADATAYAGEADIAQITSPRPLVGVGDGDDVLGLQVIATPGHTPGHISVFDPASGLLVAGDALANVDGLSGSIPQFTADETMANESVMKLAALAVDEIVFGHGDPISQNAQEMLAELAAST